MSKLLLGLLASFGFSLAQVEIEQCFRLVDVWDYKRAIEVGMKAVERYPDNPRAYLCVGEALYMMGELNPAFQAMQTAEKLATDKEELIHIYNLLGLIYYRQDKLDDALLYYSRALRLAKGLEDTDMEASILSNIAGVYSEKGDLEKALSYYEESLGLLEEDELYKTPIYNGMAMIYDKMGDHTKAIEYLHKAESIAERHGEYHRLAIYKLNIGDIYIKTKDYEKAERYLSEGLSMIVRVGDKLWEAGGYTYLGLLYKDKGEKSKAIENLRKAYEIFNSIGAHEHAQSVLEELKALELEPEKKQEVKKPEEPKKTEPERKEYPKRPETKNFEQREDKKKR